MTRDSLGRAEHCHTATADRHGPDADAAVGRLKCTPKGI